MSWQVISASHGLLFLAETGGVVGVQKMMCCSGVVCPSECYQSYFQNVTLICTLKR